MNEKPKRKDKETRFLYAVDEDKKQIYDLEITEYLIQEMTSLIASYFRDKHLCLALFSLQSKESYDQMQNYVRLFEEFNQFSPYASNVIVIGNKVDIK